MISNFVGSRLLNVKICLEITLELTRKLKKPRKNRSFQTPIFTYLYTRELVLFPVHALRTGKNEVLRKYGPCQVVKAGTNTFFLLVTKAHITICLIFTTLRNPPKPPIHYRLLLGDQRRANL